MTKSNIVTGEYRGLNFDHHSGMQSNYQKDILDRVIDMVDQYTDKHKKTCSIRYDIRYPKDDEANTENDPKIFSRFIASLKKNADRKDLDLAYIYAKERFKSKRDHIHMMVLVDGSKLRKDHNLSRKTDELFCRANGLAHDSNSGLVQSCGAVFLNKNNEEFDAKRREAVSRGSYLAKSATKKGVNSKRTFGSSRIQGTSD